MSFDTKTTIELLLRVGVGFAFIYPAISAWFNPYAWVGYFPSLASQIMGPNELLFLHLFGIFEILIGLWIISGKHILAPSVIASALLFLIVIFNFNQFDVLFRDVPILLMALALFVLQKEKGLSSRTS